MYARYFAYIRARRPMPSGASHHATSWLPGTTIVELTRSAFVMNSRARWNSPARARCDTSPESHDVVLPILNQRFDRLVLLGHRGVPEVQIGDSERARGVHASQLGDDGVGELRRWSRCRRGRA